MLILGPDIETGRERQRQRLRQRQTQTDRETDRQTDRRTGQDRTDRQTDRQDRPQWYVGEILGGPDFESLVYGGIRVEDHVYYVH